MAEGQEGKPRETFLLADTNDNRLKLNAARSTYTYSGTDIVVHMGLSPDVYREASAALMRENSKKAEAEAERRRLLVEYENSLRRYEDSESVEDLFYEKIGYPDQNPKRVPPSVPGYEETEGDSNAASYNKKVNAVSSTLSNTKLIEVQNIQTLSYSVYREKPEVRKLGHTRVAGFGRGGVTIAGTIIFTVSKQRILDEFYELMLSGDPDLRVDELPPVDIFITYANEVGILSRMAIFGVDFMNEGQVHSVHDLYTENSVNYMARAMMPMRSLTDRYRPTEEKLRALWGQKLEAEDYRRAREIINRSRKMFL